MNGATRPSASTAASAKPSTAAARRFGSMAESNSGEPGQADIGFPAADVQRQREFRGAEVPEVIINEASRGAGGARFAEHRIDRRQPLPRHSVDERDLGMIENRRGEMHAVLRMF